jgi:hypothetical protein
LIPSSQTETPLIDLNALSENVALVAGNSGTITAPFTTNVNTIRAYTLVQVFYHQVAFTLFGKLF